MANSTPKVLYAIGDFHIGNQNYKSNLLYKSLLKIADDYKNKILLMGDYCEFINKRTYGYESQTITPKNQFKIFKQYFKGFAENNRKYPCAKRGQIIS